MGRSYRLNLDDFKVVVIEEEEDFKITTAFKTVEDYIAAAPAYVDANQNGDAGETSLPPNSTSRTKAPIHHTKEGIYEPDEDGWYTNKGVLPSFLEPLSSVHTWMTSELSPNRVSAMADCFRWWFQNNGDDIIKFKPV